ncbi:MAG: hypothetical protein R3Y28_00060 [Candidatus Gastranaerophilales bacterium]
MRIQSINAISYQNPNFKGQTSEDKKDTAKDVVTGGGAIAATKHATTNIAKTPNEFLRKAGQTSSKLKEGQKAVEATIENGQKAGSMMQRLWQKTKNAKSSMTERFIKWGENAKASKFVKPLLQSKVYKYSAGFIGYGFGAVTLINGLCDISDLATNTAKGNLEFIEELAN